MISIFHSAVQRLNLWFTIDGHVEACFTLFISLIGTGTEWQKIARIERADFLQPHE